MLLSAHSWGRSVCFTGVIQAWVTISSQGETGMCVCSNLARKATEACWAWDVFLEARLQESTLSLLGKASLLGWYFVKR